LIQRQLGENKMKRRLAVLLVRTMTALELFLGSGSSGNLLFVMTAEAQEESPTRQRNKLPAPRLNTIQIPVGISLTIRQG
jgi:hypothetical protein